MTQNEMKKIKVVCYYHRIDLDGHCSAAIVRRWAKDQGCEFVGIPVDYSDGLEPFENLPSVEKGDIGVMVDFCAPTAEIMLNLNKHFGGIIWVDHHKSAIEMMNKVGGWQPPGLRRIGDAACELCLEYFFPGEKNEIVSLLGRYDVWDKDCKEFDWEDDIVPFQLAMRMKMGATLEDDKFTWGYYLNPEVHDQRKTFVYALKQQGRLTQRYDQSLRKTDQQHAYRTEWEGIKCVCINSSLRGSGTLESICEPDEMMVVWRFDGKQWTIGLYSHPESDIDCGAIASEHGGGGHKNAAGFRIKAEYSPLYQFQPPGRVKELAEFGTPLSKGP